MKYDLSDEISKNKLDFGHIFSSRDLCALEYIPKLIKAGVSCFKIEGRMKSPTYVGVVTSIYRKYIDLANSKQKYIIDPNDKKKLMQVFNRGSFSTGHLDTKPNLDLVFKEKPNNMGLFLGIVEKYNKNKGYITLKLNENICIGDSISLENEKGLYNVSELMKNDNNISSSTIGQTVTIGRMKGNISLGNKVYKLSDKLLNKSITEINEKENIKIPLSCTVNIKKDKNIKIEIKYEKNKYTSSLTNTLYENLNICVKSDIIPIEAINKPITKELVINQISKTTDTPYEFTKININMDDNLFIPKLSSLNNLRRTSLELVEDYISNLIKPSSLDLKTYITKSDQTLIKNIDKNTNLNISLLLNFLDLSFDYDKLTNITNIYIPLRYFSNKKYEYLIKNLGDKFNLYIYLPTIIKSNFKNIFQEYIEKSIDKFNIYGIVSANLSNLTALR